MSGSTDRTLQPLTPLLDDQGRPDWIATAYDQLKQADRLRRLLRQERARRAGLNTQLQQAQAECRRLRGLLGEVVDRAGQSTENRQAA